MEAPAGDEKDRYRWNQQDTDNIINSMTALDEKYHFMGNWIQYMPELFALIVVGGIVAKLVLGSRWKNAQKQAGPAAPSPEQKPGILDRLRGAVQPATGPPAGGVPPDLVKEAAAYIETSKRPQS